MGIPSTHHAMWDRMSGNHLFYINHTRAQEGHRAIQGQKSDEREFSVSVRFRVIKRPEGHEIKHPSKRTDESWCVSLAASKTGGCPCWTRHWRKFIPEMMCKWIDRSWVHFYCYRHASWSPFPKIPFKQKKKFQNLAMLWAMPKIFILFLQFSTFLVF